jgi:hypothetical protein
MEFQETCSVPCGNSYSSKKIKKITHSDCSFRKAQSRLHGLNPNLPHEVMLESLTLPNSINSSPNDTK